MQRIRSARRNKKDSRSFARYLNPNSFGAPNRGSRQKKWSQALEIWQKFIEKGEEIIFACEELAKFYEHREINIEQAIEYTNRAIDFLNIVKEIEAKEGNDDIRDRFNHRLNRLNDRLRKRIDRSG